MNKTLQIALLIGWVLLFNIFYNWSLSLQPPPMVGLPQEFMLVSYGILLVIAITQWPRRRLLIPSEYLTHLIVGLYLGLIVLTLSRTTLSDIFVYGYSVESMSVFRFAVFLFCFLVGSQVFASRSANQSLGR